MLSAAVEKNCDKKNCDKKYYRNRIKDHTDNNLIVNLTDEDIPKPLKSILSKGLKFVPTPPHTTMLTLSNSFKQFTQTMYIHYHFRHSLSPQSHPFKTKSSWTPPIPDNINLMSYINSIAESIQYTFPTTSQDPIHPNLNKEEQDFFSNYDIHNQNFVIKPADKGGAIVIWSNEDYEQEAHSQLNDKKYYEFIQTPPDHAIMTQTTSITNYLKALFKFGDIDYKTLQYLKPSSPPRTPIFYLLPKIHKPNNPGGRIISGCDSPTDRLSSYIDTHIQHFCPELPSYIKDTNHFLKIIFNIPTPLPLHTILATIDVKSLYTNISHEEGIRAILTALDNKHGRMWPTRKIIHKFLEYILKGNYFTFQNQLYLQIHGTAMGTKMAPSYANIFMGSLEASILSSALQHLAPLLWKRYIHDIFLIWTHGEVSFLKFTEHLNTFHPTKACKTGLIFSQLLRYRRLITDDREFQKKAQILRAVLLGRGHKDRDILSQIKKASEYSQSQLLNTPPPTQTNHRLIPFIIPYNPDLAPLSNIETTLGIYPK